jgi:IPT/TIG domain
MNTSLTACLRYFSCFAIVLTLLDSVPNVQGRPQSASRPIILFTDVISGPNAGGEGDNGIYLTIFGTHFGATQGKSKVTINGKAVAQYLLWSDTKIGVQVGHVSTGPIVVIAGGVSSNLNLTFTVRSGRLFYIGASIDNSTATCAGGTYAKPWGLANFASKIEAAYTRAMRTPHFYYNCMTPGDTLVFLNGVSYPYFDGAGWHSSLTLEDTREPATSSRFYTFMARPGASVQLGGTGWAMAPIRDHSNGYNVISGLTLTGSGPNGGASFSAGGASRNDRVVGNDITCPDCWGPAGAVMGGDGFIMYGNIVHDVSTLDRGGSNKTYHAVYVGGNNIEIAWNRIYNTKAYNGIQINHDKSSGFYNQSWHDNDIADVNGSGINLSTIDPSMGYIKIYNNVIHHVGVAMASDNPGPHSCLAIKGYGSATATGAVEIYNNTMVDCSSYLDINPSDSLSCAIVVSRNQLNVTTTLMNNIVYQPAYAGTSKENAYICGGGSIGTLSGSNNLWYSERTPRSSAPANSYGTFANPRFASATDYHLQSGSPAIGAGISFGDLKNDHDATPRRNPPTIGAYE